MSNIVNQIGFEGVANMEMPEEMRPIINALISRLEAFRNRLYLQLTSEVTLYFADPDNEPEKIIGFKTGDVAFWVDSGGTSQFRVLVR